MMQFHSFLGISDGGKSFHKVNSSHCIHFYIARFFFLTIMYNKEDGKLTNKWQSQRVTECWLMGLGSSFLVLRAVGGGSSLYLF